MVRIHTDFTDDSEAVTPAPPVFIGKYRSNLLRKQLFILKGLNGQIIAEIG